MPHVTNILDALLLLAVAAFVVYPWATGRRRRDWLRPLISVGLVVYAALRIFGVLALMIVGNLVVRGVV